MKWVSADIPPVGTKGCWSRVVVGVTNAENAYRISYFHGDDGGVWQRPKSFEAGEYVVCWTELPVQP